MKKLIYMITVLTFSSIVFSCAEEVVTPIDEVETPTEESTEGGGGHEEAGGSKID